MFEARLAQGAVLKAVIEAFKDMVTEGTWDCDKKGITMQVCSSPPLSPPRMR